jgi:hypothetical protein
VQCGAIQYNAIRLADSPRIKVGKMVKEDNSTPVFTMRLDSGLREKLEKIAKRDDRSIAYVVRKAVEEFVKREGK